MGIFKKLLGGIALLGFCSATFAATPLVDVEWVKANSCDSGVRVLDVRSAVDGGSRVGYMRGHIPCAIYSNYIKDGWRATAGKVPGQLPPLATAETLIGGLGIDNNTHVVIYHAGNSASDLSSATRVYWTFKVYGHDNVSILNGGFRAYSAAGHELEKGNKKVEAKTFTGKLNKSLVATKEDVKAGIDNGVSLVDNRSADQFIGVNHHGVAKRSGTIATAKNVPVSWITVNGGGTFRDVESLKKLYQIANVDTTKDAISFCNTGHWGSLGWFVTSELMGAKASLYDGSMAEWSADPSLPMEAQVSF